MKMHLLFIVVVYCGTVTALDPKFKTAQQIHQRHKRAFVEKGDCQKMIEKYGMSMINYGIEDLSNGTEKYEGRFFQSLQSIFMIIQKKRNATKWTIAESLKDQYRRSYNILRRSRDDDLEISLIQLYSADEIYSDLSAALAQHKCTTKSLSVNDRALAPYATALFATILYWKDLMAASKTTYRGIQDIQGDMAIVLKPYKKGESIVLPQFTSSSDRREVSMETFLAPGTDKNIFLIIDNSQDSEWRPKGISQFSEYPDESEFLYPPAAKFKVLSDPVKKTVKIGQNSRDERTFYEIKLKLTGMSLKHKIRKTLRKICPWIKEK
ncbi:uncharacterized protein LOC134283482 [Saccostrea cucullata]|uniref:uncharacterized protein LOC134283482 n=1 Tax=Saccostrea cuccullata TaxID=36930 RepID=UPI002ED41271